MEESVPVTTVMETPCARHKESVSISDESFTPMAIL